VQDRIELRLDVEVADVDSRGKPTILHFSHPKLDGVLELYLDYDDDVKERLSLMEIPPTYVEVETKHTIALPGPSSNNGKTGYRDGSIVDNASKLIEGINFFRSKLKK
jgi:hypothetical protein